MHLYGTGQINEQGNLEIGGCDTVDLVKEFGTPLYVYDTALIKERARGFKQTFEKMGVKAQVAYASKAFSSVAIYQLMDDEGMSLDVVSSGELFTAIQAGFPAERIHLHGNNKSKEELSMALNYGIGCIVVDNFFEIELLKEVVNEVQMPVNILIRVTPGIEAHTHDYILTGQEDSKFGFDLNNGQADRALQLCLEQPLITVLGVHCHIGSQIFETTGFILAADKIVGKMADWKKSVGFTPTVLNLGGGFGIRYTEEDEPLEPYQYVEKIVHHVQDVAANNELDMPEIWIEPGRSLVGDAGTTLYQVGSTKDVPDTRTYLAVDGGMSDNIRPALYDAKYEAILANKATKENTKTYAIAGKCCESGDMLIWDLPLPEASPGDILAVFCTGAYGYSMASNYNRLTKPAVVFVENGEARLVVRRESLEDLVKNDLPYVKQSV
ncbi:diaminopimelate decarboxylase [Mangrovibacillus cuniculi]|uniref:Diaminopimelate decarboxylase n=1 Tax=Mangrovibacillus cuniculi TaxID=2593652 RepID=A0A7S8CB55_9BACI|nr:diaminopimelate decarboxylase [Mangrovibacillus cuniculi]QPC46749.1 diaminopimelate decarboxylase [Mangrovibacillus cuniculi]